MRVGLLFSGGTDSTLAALLLDPYFDVTLITVHFGVTDQWRRAEEVASAVGLPFKSLALERQLAEDALDQILADGYHRHGIDALHLAALEAVAASGYDTVADGTRRDDRVPSVSRAKVQRLENTYDVDYVAPLSGFGRRAVDLLADRLLKIEVGPIAEIQRPDYETELRALGIERGDGDALTDVFSKRQQTAVTGLQ